METIGAKLKKIRLEKGVTLEEAHKQTKIHLNILKAIEEESLVNFSPVYIKGFLKIYCDFLGVNPSEYIVEDKRMRALIKDAPESSKKRISLPIKMPSKTTVLIVIISAAAVIGLFNLGKFIFGHLSRKPALSARAAAQRQTGSKSPQQNISSGIRLSIRAKEDCWIQLKSDGKIIFQNVLRKARSETWQAKNKIELTLGNAGAVDLEVNGKIIPALGRRGQVVKNILITKDGLTIAKR